MILRRYELLMKYGVNFLTNEEIEQGWHFCPEWDFLLIGEEMVESEYCNCVINNKNIERRYDLSDGDEVKPNKKRKTKLDKVIDQYEIEIDKFGREIDIRRDCINKLREQA